MIDGLRRLLFEDLTLLLIAEMIALAIAIAIHRRRYTAKSRRGVWLTLAVCALFIMQSLMIKTDRERLIELIREMAVAVDRGDVRAVEQRLDETFLADGRDKPTFTAEVNDWLQRWQIDEAKIGRKVEVVIDNDSSMLTFRAFCDARNNRDTYYGTISKWQVSCIRRERDWKVQGVKLLNVRIGLLELNQIGDVFRY